MTSALIDHARAVNKVPSSAARPTICFDEWNVWDPLRAIPEQGAEEQYDLSDALAVAVWLNVFVRQSRSMGMANIAQSINVISPLMTSKDGISKQTTWYPLLLFSKYMRGWTVAVHVSGEEYEGKTAPDWIRNTIETPYLDVSATVSEDGWVALAVVNIHADKAIEADLEGVASKDTQVYTVTGADVSVSNKDGKDAVGIQESSWDGQGKFTFPKHSFTLLRWKS